MTDQALAAQRQRLERDREWTQLLGQDLRRAQGELEHRAESRRRRTADEERRERTPAVFVVLLLVISLFGLAAFVLARAVSDDAFPLPVTAPLAGGVALVGATLLFASRPLYTRPTASSGTRITDGAQAIATGAFHVLALVLLVVRAADDGATSAVWIGAGLLVGAIAVQSLTAARSFRARAAGGGDRLDRDAEDLLRALGAARQRYLSSGDRDRAARELDGIRASVRRAHGG